MQTRHEGAAALAPPAVPAETYDSEYYLDKCAGHAAWVESGGADPDPLYRGSLMKAGVGPGDVVVDIGTGRGELLAVAVEMGAASAVGIEYSRSALDLARRTREASTAGPAIALIAADARRLPLPSGFADLVVMLDVVEHLVAGELAQCLAEAARILRPGGRVFVHTFPTRTVYDVTYRLQRWSRPWRWRRWPADPRSDGERQMHVYEQSRSSLRRHLRSAGFEGVSVEYGEWVWDGFVPDEAARPLYRRLARLPLVKGLGVADLWAEAVRPATRGLR